MKIDYLAFIRLPTEKAHGIQIMKVCEALANTDAEINLLLPGRKTAIADDPYQYYEVKSIFKIITARTPDFLFFGRIGFIFSQILFAAKTIWSATKPDIVISQDEWVLLFHILYGRRCVYEVHNGRKNIAAQFVSKRAILLVANSHGTRSFYIEKGIPEEKILMYPNGVDIKRFDSVLTKQEARRQLSLPEDKKLILYTGHLYDWKGADTLAKATQLLSDDAVVVFVGGIKDDVTEFRKTYNHPRLLILGHKPSGEIPVYLGAADVLVLPNNRLGESERFTSPMKVFEYLAAGKPIVASNLPPIREVLHDANAFFFTPGDPDALAKAIKRVFENPALTAQKARRAKHDAQKYTWDRTDLVLKLREVIDRLVT